MQRLSIEVQDHRAHGLHGPMVEGLEQWRIAGLEVSSGVGCSYVWSSGGLKGECLDVAGVYKWSIARLEVSRSGWMDVWLAAGLLGSKMHPWKAGGR